MALQQYPVRTKRPKQTKSFSNKTQQYSAPFEKKQLLKYSTIIQKFLSGVTLDVLRMRLRQAVISRQMSISEFLEENEVSIIKAVGKLKELIILVYPPNNGTTDFRKWSLRLFCTVFRASNCLNVREHDDVIYIDRMYKRYFSSWAEGTISSNSRRGSIAKREWIRLCSAVQRLVENVGDRQLIKSVRNFICKVEMESKTTEARTDTQNKLEMMISELKANAQSSKHNYDIKDDADFRKQLSGISKLKQDYESVSKEPSLCTKSATGARPKPINDGNEEQRRLSMTTPLYESKGTNTHNDIHVFTDSKNANVKQPFTEQLQPNTIPLFESKGTNTSDENVLCARSINTNEIHSHPLQTSDQKAEIKHDDKILKTHESATQTDGNKTEDKPTLKRTNSSRYGKVNLKSYSALTRIDDLYDIYTSPAPRMVIQRPAYSSLRPTSAGICRRPSSASVRPKSATFRPRSRPSSACIFPVSASNVPISIHSRPGSARLKPLEANKRSSYAISRSISTRLRSHSVDWQPNRTGVGISRSRPVSAHSASNVPGPDTTTHTVAADSRSFSVESRIPGKSLIHSRSRSHSAQRKPLLGKHTYRRSKPGSAPSKAEEASKTSLNAVILIPTGDNEVDDDVKQGQHFVKARITNGNDTTRNNNPNEDSRIHSSNHNYKSNEKIQLNDGFDKSKVNAELKTMDKPSEIKNGAHAVDRKLDRKAEEKRKANEDSIKKIANDVLVHQQTHVAAKDPMLKDREFVDGFFRFMRENQVTKKFLRTDNNEPHKTWRLPDGSKATFSFLHAFIFRHIEEKESDTSMYVVRKILHRMQCHHDNKPTRSSSEQTRSTPKMQRTNDIQNVSPTSCKPVKTQATTLTSGNIDSQQPKLQNTHGHVYAHGKLGTTIGRLDSPRISRADTPRRNVRSTHTTAEHTDDMPKTSSVKQKARRSQSFDPESNSSPSSKQHRSVSIMDNQCWKCNQKKLAMTICVNWRNKSICQLLLADGVPFREEHLVPAVRANDLDILKEIVTYLKKNNDWFPGHDDVKTALYVARYHRMKKMAAYLEQEGVQDDRRVVEQLDLSTNCMG